MTEYPSYLTRRKDGDVGRSLQARIREMLVDAIVSGRLRPGSPVPSSRAMAAKLNISRNTVTLAYQALLAGGFLVSKERAGFFVASRVARTTTQRVPPLKDPSEVDWQKKISARPASFDVIRRPTDWHKYPYPFVYGQVDPTLFPIVAWRDCVRQSMSKKWQNAWTDDLYMRDDPLLVAEIRSKVLARRGIFANADEILITLGSQNALYLAAQLLIRQGTEVAMEEPGYYAARSVFQLAGGRIRPMKVDLDGLNPKELPDVRIVFVTPNHQFPTNVPLSLTRRNQLLEWAHATDSLIFEDDYESEINYAGKETASLKALDRQGRVIYFGSFSKSLMPGLRVGYVVAPPELVEEMRALRGLIMRHPPSNNQRAVALFLSLGHHESFMTRLQKAYAVRWKVLDAALLRFLPGWTRNAIYGGSSFWLAGPPDFSATGLAARALERGVVIEPGRSLFLNEAEADRYFRLGFSSIAADRITDGIQALAAIA